MRNLILVTADISVEQLVQKNCNLLDVKIQALDKPALLLKTLKKQKPDVLLIDFILNDDNGGGLCHQLKSDPELNDLPVILLSEYYAIDRLACKLGCNATLRKPINITQLAKVINGLLKPQTAA
jgi:CheY-like chemotaxis protein